MRRDLSGILKDTRIKVVIRLIILMIVLNVEYVDALPLGVVLVEFARAGMKKPSLRQTVNDGCHLRCPGSPHRYCDDNNSGPK